MYNKVKTNNINSLARVFEINYVDGSCKRSKYTTVSLHWVNYRFSHKLSIIDNNYEVCADCVFTSLSMLAYRLGLS